MQRAHPSSELMSCFIFPHTLGSNHVYPDDTKTQMKQNPWAFPRKAFPGTNPQFLCFVLRLLHTVMEKEWESAQKSNITFLRPNIAWLPCLIVPFATIASPCQVSNWGKNDHMCQWISCVPEWEHGAMKINFSCLAPVSHLQTGVGLDNVVHPFNSDSTFLILGQFSISLCPHTFLSMNSVPKTP
jgi:hypothetical protein